MMSEGIFNVTTVRFGGQVLNIHLYITWFSLVHATIFNSAYIAFDEHAINIAM